MQYLRKFLCLSLSFAALSCSGINAMQKSDNDKEYCLKLSSSDLKIQGLIQKMQGLFPSKVQSDKQNGYLFGIDFYYDDPETYEKACNIYRSHKGLSSPKKNIKFSKFILNAPKQEIQKNYDEKSLDFGKNSSIDWNSLFGGNAPVFSGVTKVRDYPNC